jgi:hypothetical protein
MTEHDNSSRFGDVWHTPEPDWYRRFCGGDGPPYDRCPIVRFARSMAPWWARDLVMSVRYRADELSADQSVVYAKHLGNPYERGTLTVFYRRPNQVLGPYLSKSRRLVDGEYFRIRGDA